MEVHCSVITTFFGVEKDGGGISLNKFIKLNNRSSKEGKVLKHLDSYIKTSLTHRAYTCTFMKLFLKNITASIVMDSSIHYWYFHWPDFPSFKACDSTLIIAVSFSSCGRVSISAFSDSSGN